MYSFQRLYFSSLKAPFCLFNVFYFSSDHMYIFHYIFESTYEIYYVQPFHNPHHFWIISIYCYYFYFWSWVIFSWLFANWQFFLLDSRYWNFTCWAAGIWCFSLKSLKFYFGTLLNYLEMQFMSLVFKVFGFVLLVVPEQLLF